MTVIGTFHLYRLYPDRTVTDLGLSMTDRCRTVIAPGPLPKMFTLCFTPHKILTFLEFFFWEDNVNIFQKNHRSFFFYFFLFPKNLKKIIFVKWCTCAHTLLWDSNSVSIQVRIRVRVRFDSDSDSSQILNFHST